MSRFARLLRQWSVIYCLFLLTGPLMAMDPAEEEFLIKKDYYSTRFDGYYEHFLEKDKKDEERLKGADAERQSRKRQLEDAERARREYIASRKTRPVEDETKWMQEIQARAREQELYRKDYSRRQKELQSFIKKYNYIPPEEEFEIDVFYFEE